MIEDVPLEADALRERLQQLECRLRAEVAVKDRLERELNLRNSALDAGASHFMIIDACQPKPTIVYVNRALARAHG